MIKIPDRVKDEMAFQSMPLTVGPVARKNQKLTALISPAAGVTRITGRYCILPSTH